MHKMFRLALLTMLLSTFAQGNAREKYRSECSSSSSSSSDTSDSCCEKTLRLLKEINKTTNQDLAIDQTTLDIVNQIDETTLEDLAVDVEILDIVTDLQDCSCTCQVILPEDFEDDEGNLTQTYFITEPGSYCLGADVAFVPEDEFTPAINILANDVRLDLRGYTLSQANSTPNAYGVQIGQGYLYEDPDAVLKNITVLNGSITHFTGIGIFCYNASFDEPTAEVAFESFTFSDLNVLDCGSDASTDFASGIDLDSSADDSLYLADIPVAYKNVTISNCNINRCLGAGAINIYIADGVVIRDTQANDLRSNASSLGIGLVTPYDIECRNLQMFNCQGNGAKDLDPDNNGIVGSFFGQSINVYMNSCQFNDTFGEADFLVTVNLSNCQNALFENCQFNNMRGGESAYLMGVHASDGTLQQTQADGMKFINCQFNGASVSSTNSTTIGNDPVIYGFSAITLRDIVFENCQACNIITDNPLFHAYGFSVGTSAEDPTAFYASSRNSLFSNCIASDIQAPRRALGFRMSGSANNRRGTQAQLDNMVVENCIAERIYSSSDEEEVAGIFEGFGNTVLGPFPAEFNLFVKNCRVSDVRAGSENPLSAGIIAEAVHRPVIIQNSVSDCDRGILLTGTDQITPNDLFQLAATEEDALAFPPVFINLTSIPSSTPAQTFTNLEAGRGGPVSINPSATTINLLRDYLFSTPVDLNFTGGAAMWQPGDRIVYNNGGGTDIGGLVSGTTYYLIVYIPGFSTKGLIQENKVDNCSISCYRDDAPTTSSAWVDNTAFNCGLVPDEFTNYDITFAGVRPVDAGTLSAYPVGGNKYYNLSLVP